MVSQGWESLLLKSYFPYSSNFMPSIKLLCMVLRETMFFSSKLPVSVTNCILPVLFSWSTWHCSYLWTQARCLLSYICALGADIYLHTASIPICWENEWMKNECICFPTFPRFGLMTSPTPIFIPCTLFPLPHKPTGSPAPQLFCATIKLTLHREYRFGEDKEGYVTQRLSSAKLEL